MQLDQPLRLITPTVDGDVLAALARVEAGFTPPQLHRVIERHSVDGIRKALRRLETQGIVQQDRVGHADLYTFNREHIAAPYIIGLAQLRQELIEKMRTLFASWTAPCAYAALFGSGATGDMRADSDIDVFIVRPDEIDPDDDIWLDQLYEFTRAASTWTGNDVRPFEMSVEEVERGLHSGKEPVLDDIRDQGIRLYGEFRYLSQSAA